MSTEKLPIEEHPDIATLRGRYERIGESRTVQLAAGLTVLAGMFVALSPWIVGFSAQMGLPVNNLLVGLAAVALAIGFASTFRTTHGLAWVVPLLGVLTIISPWVVAGANATLGVILANVIGGAVLLFAGQAVSGLRMLRRGT